MFWKIGLMSRWVDGVLPNHTSAIECEGVRYFYHRSDVNEGHFFADQPALRKKYFARAAPSNGLFIPKMTELMIKLNI